MLLVPNKVPTFLTNLFLGEVLDFRKLDRASLRTPTVSYIVPPLEVAKPSWCLRELPNQAWYLPSHNKKGIHR